MGNRLYVGNISYSTTKETLEQVFAEAGKVSRVDVITDRETGAPRGFAFVTMETDADAQSAISSLDGRNVDGRNIRVNEAQEKPRGNGGGQRSFTGGGGRPQGNGGGPDRGNDRGGGRGGRRGGGGGGRRDRDDNW